MDNQPPSPASAPVTPAGTAYVPPAGQNPPVSASPPPTNPLPTPPNPPTQMPPKKSRSWMLIIGSILLLLLIGGGGYFYFMNTQKPEPAMQPIPTVKPSPTTLPTPIASPAATASVSADWKTYTNATLGIELQYPPILTASSVKGEYYTQKADKVNLRNYTPEEEYLHKDAVSITISVISVGQPISNLQKWLEDISIGSRIDGKVGVRIGKVNPYKNSVINGLEYIDGQESVWRNIAVQKDNKVFIFTLNPTSETGGSYDENKNAVEIFNQILSTFKFTE